MRSGTGNHNACKPKLRKGLWSPEEDEKLVRHITKYGHKCWSIVPKQAGLQRCGKSCRLRWINYLRPDLKRGQFSQEEEELIIKLHSMLGNRWAQIATQLPGRTDNEIKNFWNSCLRKKLRQNGLDPATHKPLSDILPAKLGNMIPPAVPSTTSSSSLNGTATMTTSAMITTTKPAHVPAASRPPIFKQQISGDDTETSIVNSPFTMSMLPIKLDPHGEDGWSSLPQQQQQQQQEHGFVELPALTNSDTFSTIFSPTYDDHVTTTSSEEDSEFMHRRNSANNNNASAKILFPFWEPVSKPSTTTTISNNNNSNNVSCSWPFPIEPVFSPLPPPSSPLSVHHALTRWPLATFDSMLETSTGSSHVHGAPDFYYEDLAASRDGGLSCSTALLSSVLDRM